jgi:hypothetical protein
MNGTTLNELAVKNIPGEGESSQLSRTRMERMRVAGRLIGFVSGRSYKLSHEAQVQWV